MNVNKETPLLFRTADEYQAAIASLEASTEATEHQINVSRKFLTSISRQNAPAIWKQPHKAKPLSEQQQLSSLISALRNDIYTEHKNTSDKLHKTLSTTLTTITDTLRQHDYILDQLDKQSQPLGPESESDTDHDHDHDHEYGYQQTLLDILQHTQAETIRTRLNRIYLAASSTTSSSKTNESSTTTLKAIQTDLKTLHTEIPSVSEMLVLHNHGTPLLSTLESLTTARQHLQRQQTKHASAQLQAITQHLKDLASHCLTLKSQRLVNETLERCLRDIKAADSHSHHSLTTTTTSTSTSKHESSSALAALRTYLNLTLNFPSSTKTHTHDEDAQLNITNLFETYTTHVRSAMDIQARQAEYLAVQQPSRRDGDGEREQEQEQEKETVLVGSGSGYGALETKLDLLASEIGAVRIRMEGVFAG